MAKAQFLQQTQTAATALANAVAACSVVAEVWTDRGANLVTDADLTSLGVGFNLAQLQAFIALIPTIQTFWTANHGKINTIRSDL